MKRFLLLSLTFLLFVTSVDAAQWIQKGESAFAEGEISNTEIYGVGANASIMLEAITQEEWGNNFIIEKQEKFALDNEDEKISFRFTVSRDINVDNLHLYVSFRSPNSPTYTVGLQTNNPAGNKPSGVWLSSAPFKPPALYWQQISTSTVSLSAGTIYHLVVEYLSGTIESGFGRYMGIGYTTPSNLKIPYDNSDAPVSEVLIDDGFNWDYQVDQPVYVLEDITLGLYEGNPFYVPEDIRIFGTSEHVGEEFVLHDKDRSVSKVDFYIRSYEGRIPLDDLYVVLKNKANNEILESGTVVRKDDITTNYTWVSYTFDTPDTLRTGTTYQLYLKSPLSDNENCYQVKVLNISPFPDDQAKTQLRSITYLGEDAFSIEGDGTAWEEYKYRDMIFKFFSATYYSSGEYNSKVFDTGSPSEFKKISWEPVSQPSQVSLKFQIATSESPNGPWLFFGPDGTISTYYTQGEGQDISSRHSGKRHIKYKAFFTSSDSSYSPQLNKITIEYDARPLQGTALEIRNTPNPFQAGIELTSIKYILEKDSNVTIEIYTLLGDLVKKIKKSPGEEGGRGEENGYENSVDWDGRNGKGMLVANGVYLCRIIAEPQDGSKSIEEIRKIAVIK